MRPGFIHCRKMNSFKRQNFLVDIFLENSRDFFIVGISAANSNFN